MHQGLSLSFRLEQRQQCECTLRLADSLQDPVAYAEALFDASRKVNVPIRVGSNTIVVRAALVKGGELGQIFDGEAFGGAIGRYGEEPLLFMRKDLTAPEEFAAHMPQLIAFHCISSVKVPRWDDETGTLAQYQAIALELAYARRLMPQEAYGRYEEWRKGVERSPFFQRPDWKEIAGKAHEAFREHAEGVHRNAHALKLPVLTHGDVLRLEGDRAIGPSGEAIPVFKKQRRPQR